MPQILLTIVLFARLLYIILVRGTNYFRKKKKNFKSIMNPFCILEYYNRYFLFYNTYMFLLVFWGKYLTKVRRCAVV